MKVYIVTRESFPNGMAATKRIKAYAVSWIKAGIEVEVLIYKRTERYGYAPKNTIGSGVVDGVPFRYIGGTPLRGSNIIIRRINDYIDRHALLNYLRNNLKKGDVVFGYTGYDFFINKIIKVVRKKEAVFAIELCELPFGTTKETDKTKNNRKKFEQQCMPNIDGVIAISDALADYAQIHGNRNIQIGKVPILVDLEANQLPDNSFESDVPFIFHAGTLTEQKDGFVSMLKAFADVVRQLDNVKFISTGSPEMSIDKEDIESIIRSNNLEDKVVFTGYLSDDDVRDYLSKASLVVINKLPTQQNKYCFSTKLGEYMAAGKVIVTTDVGEASNWLTSGKDCIMVPARKNDALVNAMITVLSDNELRKTLGENARKTAKSSFSIDANVNSLRDIICNLSDSVIK